MVGEILNDVSDIVAAAFSVTKERAEVLDYMAPFKDENMGFFISAQTSYSWKTFLLPFLSESWAALSVMLLALTFGFALVVKLGRDKCLEEFTLRKCATYIFGAYGGITVGRWSVTPKNI